MTGDECRGVRNGITQKQNGAALSHARRPVYFQALNGEEYALLNIRLKVRFARQVPVVSQIVAVPELRCFSNALEMPWDRVTLPVSWHAAFPTYLAACNRSANQRLTSVSGRIPRVRA